MSEEEVIERLGISRITAWRLRRDGKLSYYRVGRSIRYSEQHVADFLASCEKGKQASFDTRKIV
ncbi:MAG: helix-turn-helix domain-containing protein [Acidobacteriota bacterium]|nr:helix-turn-helix domain-containing protein [Acidobacteriota bacterium]